MWFTTKDGRHVNTDWFDKDRQIAENKKEADERNGKLDSTTREEASERNSNAVSAIHLTADSNIDSILSNGFDLSKAGEEGGDVWGRGAYFLTNSKELDFYSKKFHSSTGVTANIDTSKMFNVVFNGKVYSPGNMYDLAAEQLPTKIRKEYESNVKRRGQRRALTETIAKHYTGMVLKQTGLEEVEGTTGGNQIVVYDTSVIRDIKRRKH